MSTSSRAALHTISQLLSSGSAEEIVERLKPKSPNTHPLSSEIPEQRNWSNEGTRSRQDFIKKELSIPIPYLSGKQEFEDHHLLKGNIEHFIGMTQIPTGIIGPMRINGIYARGDFYIPFATSEGVLVSSYHRGALIGSLAGGITAACLTELVQRSPVFKFRNFGECGMFLMWCMQCSSTFEAIIAEHSTHAKLEELRPNIDGNQVTLNFEYNTGDAAGQNMVTICTEAVCQYIVANSPVKPKVWYVEGNLSGDKKATALSLASVRGKKVTAEVTISADLINKIFHTSPQAMMEYWQTSMVNGVQSGSIGVNGHFSNGLAAIFLACGQDVACVAEAAVGITRFEITDQGELYACVSLPCMIVGTVGGGTWLPTQRECLQMIGCYGTGGARKFAEICAATLLCGELSIVGSIAAGDFSKAHKVLGRKKNG